MKIPAKFVAALVLCFALTICVCASPGLKAAGGSFAELPLQFDGIYLLAPVKIGDTEKWFIIDTAANATVISPATRDAPA